MKCLEITYFVMRSNLYPFDSLMHRRAASAEIWILHRKSCGEENSELQAELSINQCCEYKQDEMSFLPSFSDRVKKPNRSLE